MNGVEAKVEQQSESGVQKVWQYLMYHPVYLFLIVMIIISACLSKEFLTPTNILNILRQASFIGIASCGLTFVIILGYMDLSVGSTLSLSAVLVASLQTVIGVVPAIIVTLIVAIIIGSLNGAILSVIKADNTLSFLITMGMMYVVAAATLLYSGGYEETYLVESFKVIGKGTVFGVPIPIIVFILCVVILQFVLKKLRFGRAVEMIGGNRETARICGIQVNKVRIQVYALSALFAAIAGIILVARVSGGSPTAGDGYEFDTMAAVVVGGTSIRGGEGSLINTFFGVLVIAVIGNILNLTQTPSLMQYAIRGAIIILAVCLDILKVKARRN